MEKIERQTNFEVLRIICIVFVVLLHVCGEGDSALNSINVFYKKAIIEFLHSGGRMANTCFVMIGAWFLVDLPFKFKRILKIWAEVLFYSITITGICYIFNADIDSKTMLEAFFPIATGRFWFVSYYLALLLLSPLLNCIIRNLKKQAMLTFLILGFLRLVLYPTFIIKDNNTALYAAFFIYIYLLTGYLKKYAIEFSKNKNIYFIVFLIMYCCICILSLNIGKLTILGLNGKFHYYNECFCTLPGFICSISLFFYFINVKIKKNNIVNNISNSILAVYIIHRVPCLIPILWYKVFRLSDFYSSIFCGIYFILVTVLIILACVCIDKIRLKYIEPIFLNSSICNMICNEVDKVIN